jgi:hypothetical protein
MLSLLLLQEVHTARASHEGSYRETIFTRWDTAQLDILIVPPKHGQLVNGNGPLNGGDPAELTPFNSYVRAQEEGIRAWDDGVDRFASSWLKDNFNTDTYVVGRDVVPPAALADPEIIVTFGEFKANILGIAVRVGSSPCIIDNSMLWTSSFSYEDMYNIGMHEVGHCIGLGHVVTAEPQHDVMFPTYFDPIGAPDNHRHCPSNLNIAVLEASFGELFGRDAPVEAQMPISEYATTCAPAMGHQEPPATSQTTPPPNSNTGGAPSPTPTTSSPSPTPTSSPDPTPSTGPDPNPPREVERRVLLDLSRHLNGRGRVIASDAPEGCLSEVGVSILVLRRGEWRTVRTTSTDTAGRFRVRLPDRPGRYRAYAWNTFLPDGTGCLEAHSRRARHRH